jgi:solute carrier family 34 (sodium-dependent phosphate cotransporter)
MAERRSSKASSKTKETVPELTGPVTQIDNSRLGAWAGGLLVVLLLYVFLVSIGMLGAGFKTFGKPFANALIATTSNPFIGLFIGILATSIIQSSSTVTSMVVAFVAAGTLTVESSIPIVMGANIGTTVTNLLVSLAHMSRKAEFRRALAAATVHDFFNVMVVMVLLPLEYYTHYLQRSAEFVSTFLVGSSSMSFSSPVKVATQPLIALFKGALMGFGKGWAGTILVVTGMVMLVVSLIYITKVMRSLLITRLETFFHKTVGGSGIMGILLGLIITAVVQSSSVTTSLLVPMAATGVVTLRQVFPITLGANLGTTVTALLASLTGNAAGLTIALTHCLFNLTGTLLIYPIAAIREIPLRLAEGLARVASQSRFVAIAFVLCVFFVVPGALIFIARLF